MGNESSKHTRRQFIGGSAAGLVAVPLANALFAGTAQAQDMIDESDPVAQALGYVHDATKAAKRSDASQLCKNCQLMTGTEEWGPCTLFQGKLVNANGWCSAWVVKS